MNAVGCAHKSNRADIIIRPEPLSSQLKRLFRQSASLIAKQYMGGRRSSCRYGACTVLRSRRGGGLAAIRSQGQTLYPLWLIRAQAKLGANVLGKLPQRGAIDDL